MEEPATPVPLESLLAHRAWVRQVARALVVDESRAEDLEQEAWLEALERPPADARSLRGWLGTVVRHKAADAGRSDARREKREHAAARPEATPGAADLVAEADAHQRLVKAVLDLDEPYRSTLLLRYFEDLGPAEIARRDGVPLETVRTRLRRGREALRERFDREHEGDRGAWKRLLAPLALGAPAAAGGAVATAAGAGTLLATFPAKAAFAAAVGLLAVGLALWASRTQGDAGAPPGGTTVAAASAPPPVPGPGGPAASPPAVAAPPEAAAAAAAPPPAPQAAPAAPAPPAQGVLASPPAPPAPAPPAPAEEPAGKASLEVTVVDRRGRPLPGATVNIHGPGRPLLNPDFDALQFDPPKPRSVVREGLTDDAGRFAAESLVPGSYWARASGGGYAATTALTRLGPDPKTKPSLRLLLEPEVALTGTVRRADGTPVPGCRVVARRQRGPSFLAFDRTTTQAGPDGAYRLAGLAPGVYDLLLGPTPDLLVAAGAVEVPQVAAYDPALPAAATLRGKVLDDATGKPVAGASVRIHVYGADTAAISYARTLSGPDGAYALEGLPGGSDGWLSVRRDGYLPSFAGGSDPRAHVQGLAAGGEFQRDVRLARGGRVAGRVKDPEGKPVAGAVVYVESWTDNGVQHSPAALTGADGLFSLDPVLPEPGVLLAGARGYSQRDVGDASGWDLIREKRIPPSALVDVKAGETLARDLVLDPAPAAGEAPPPPPAVLSGRVRCADGSVPKDLRLRLLRDENGTTPYWALRMALPVECRDDGTFSLDALPPGRVALAAEARGCARVLGPWVALEPGRARDGYALTLPPGLSLCGKVVDAAGAPVRGAGIGVEEWAERHFLTVTNAEGRFTVGGLTEGDRVLTARVPGAPPATALAAAGADDVVLTVATRPTGLRGSVVDAETGAPIADITVKRSSRGIMGSGSVRTARDGSFSLPAGYGGPEEITAALADGNACSESEYVPETVVLPGPPAGELRIALRKGLAIEGRLLAEDGTPLRRRVHLDVDGVSDPGRPDIGYTWFLSTRDDGTFRIRGLPPGKVDLTFEDHDDPDFTPILLADVPAGTLDLAVRQARALPIEGRVVDEEGHRPGVDGWVQPLVRGHEAAGPALPVAMVGPDGAFRTAPVHVKDVVDLFASHFEGFVEARLEKVEPGATGVVVRLRRGATVAGRVVDESGAPVPAGVPVAAFRPRTPGEIGRWTLGTGKTGEKGEFEMKGLAGDEFQVEAGGLGCDFVPAGPPTEAKPGARDLVLRVKRGLTVEIVLLGEEKAAPPLMVHQGGESDFLEPDDDGRILVCGLQPGKFRVTDFSGETVLGDFDASAGKVEIRLR
jgi:RNA polymerase sigma factor (sigma-70 family)